MIRKILAANNDVESTQKEQIMLVDDTNENIKLVSDFLIEYGFEILVAKNGKQAIKKLEKASPNLILLDVVMPEMGGFETCRYLKSWDKTKDIPIIFMTAVTESQPKDKIKGLTLGAVDYISKPIQLEEVLARVKIHLHLRSLTGQLQEQNALLFQEIIERKQVEEALRQSEARERKKATQLEIALSQLKQTQAQLVQTEKMSSLGQMVAGIAHEINNPVSFIYSNIALARQYFQDLLNLLGAYQNTYSCPTTEIQQIIEELELDFLVSDWQKMIDSMQVGAERIKEIVHSLLLFSRLNQSEKKMVDIHEDIDNILSILQYQLKAESESEIEVIKYYGKLPKVTCYASQLNQVFMNLLINAIDALKTQLSPRVITIRTEVINKPLLCSTAQFVSIRISDNGVGINDTVLPQIFDPFFTTKPVGSGIGLGLAISYQIVVRKHKGQLHCISTLEQGTEFIVEIPIVSN